MQTKRKKTAEQIAKDQKVMDLNIKKTLTRLKTKVADREELWLDMFTSNVEVLLGRDSDHGLLADLVFKASSLADMMLDRYEERWGKG